MVPNRAREVKAIAAKYPQSFGPPDDTLDARRRLLMPIICKELNKLDGGNWALLNRLDRQDEDPKPGRLTSDVLVWKPTKEHVDVLSGSGAMWQVHPVITDPDWKIEAPELWPDWETLKPTPEPEPQPNPNPQPQPVPGDDLMERVARYMAGQIQKGVVLANETSAGLTALLKE